MKTAYWLIIIMDITLILVLWLYIHDVYIQRRYSGFEYATHIFHSDAAIPIIGLGVLLNTGALLYFLAGFKKSASERGRPRARFVPDEEIEKIGRQAEIEHLEEELKEIRETLDNLKQPSFPVDES